MDDLVLVGGWLMKWLLGWCGYCAVVRVGSSDLVWVGETIDLNRIHLGWLMGWAVGRLISRFGNGALVVLVVASRWSSTSTGWNCDAAVN